MNIPPIKMSGFGLQSLAIHPSEASLIIAAGDRKGNISEAKYLHSNRFNFMALSI